MSDFYNKYPYTDFHELNLDWVIERVKKLTEDWLATQQEWNDTEEQWQQLYNYVHDYFDNLDVFQEINDKIDAMVSDGTFLNVIRSTVEAQTIATTTNWLADHITQPTTPVVDTSLTIPGAAADSAVTGTRIANINNTKFSSIGIFTNAVQAGIYADLDNLPCNSAATFGFTPTNAPSGSFQGNVITFSGTNSSTQFIMQIACHNQPNITYIRTKYASWGSWMRIADANTPRFKILGFDTSSTQTYPDMDNLPNNSVVAYGYTPSNAPSGSFQGNVVTFCGSDTGTQFILQIASASQGNNTYIRTKYTSWGSWMRIADGDIPRFKILGVDTSSTQVYTDMDNLPNNSVVTYGYTPSNAPSGSFQGNVVTFCGSDIGTQFILQIASASQSNITYIRTKYVSWGSWMRIADANTPRFKILGFDTSSTQTYPDIDNLPNNSVVTYGYTPSHAPLSSFNGDVITFGGSDTISQFLLQIASVSQTNKAFFRAKYSSWSEWTEINRPLYNDKGFQALGDICACGDSLTAALCYKDMNTYTTVPSWATYLARECNSNATVLASGGLTVAAFIASAFYSQAVADTSQYAAVYLGTNDINQSTDLDNFETSYNTLITNLTTNHDFVLCIPPMKVTSGSSRDNYIARIKNVCNNIATAFFCDTSPYEDLLQNYAYLGHFSSAGEAALANVIEMAINDTIRNNSFFKTELDFL